MHEAADRIACEQEDEEKFAKIANIIDLYR
jgi:hypothetical protein